MYRPVHLSLQGKCATAIFMGIAIMRPHGVRRPAASPKGGHDPMALQERRPAASLQSRMRVEAAEKVQILRARS